MFKSIDDLKLFVQIYEKRSLSAVAMIAQTTPGVISKRLAQLETEFGTRLFHRTTRTIQPTDEGQRLFEQSVNLLELVEQYESEWGEKTQPSGQIRMTASASFARLYLMPLITQFIRLYPSIRISFELSDKVLDIVAEGIDLAIRGAQMNDSSLIARKLGPSPEVLCATEEYLSRAAPRRSRIPPTSSITIASCSTKTTTGNLCMKARCCTRRCAATSRPTTARRWLPRSRTGWASAWCATGRSTTKSSAAN